jgi:hypothetical protein
MLLSWIGNAESINNTKGLTNVHIIIGQNFVSRKISDLKSKKYVVITTLHIKVFRDLHLELNIVRMVKSVKVLWLDL